jgi:hypothetical protein
MRPALFCLAPHVEESLNRRKSDDLTAKYHYKYKPTLQVFNVSHQVFLFIWKYHSGFTHFWRKYHIFRASPICRAVKLQEMNELR